jgi:hypothetical protein
VKQLQAAARALKMPEKIIETRIGIRRSGQKKKAAPKKAN